MSPAEIRDKIGHALRDAAAAAQKSEKQSKKRKKPNCSPLSSKEKRPLDKPTRRKGKPPAPKVLRSCPLVDPVPSSAATLGPEPSMLCPLSTELDLLFQSMEQDLGETKRRRRDICRFFKPTAGFFKPTAEENAEQEGDGLLDGENFDEILGFLEEEFEEGFGVM